MERKNNDYKQEHYLYGVLMIILSAFCFACMNVMVRLAGEIPSVQKSFFRNLVAAVFAGMIIWRKQVSLHVKKEAGVSLEPLAFSAIFMQWIICWWQMHQS